VVLSQQDFSVFVSQVRNDIGTFQKIVEEMDILHHGFIAGASRAAKQLFETQLAKSEALGIDIENQIGCLESDLKNTNCDTRKNKMAHHSSLTALWISEIHVHELAKCRYLANLRREYSRQYLKLEPSEMDPETRHTTEAKGNFHQPQQAV
jgi:hypothetical protein